MTVIGRVPRVSRTPKGNRKIENQSGPCRSCPISGKCLACRINFLILERCHGAWNPAPRSLLSAWPLPH